jgi:hypothetical protein
MTQSQNPRQSMKPLNEIEAGNELISILKSGDVEYAELYYDKWCYTLRWTPMLAFRIRTQCESMGLNPSRWGAQTGSKQIQSPSTSRRRWEEGDGNR